MRFVCVSDTHCRLSKVAVPDGDVLIHAGDLSGRGSVSEIRRECGFLSDLPHPMKIVIPGNHDIAFQQKRWLSERIRTRFPNLTLLIDPSAVVNGPTVYGSPWTPWFSNWSYTISVAAPRVASRLKGDGRRFPSTADSRHPWAAI